MDGNLCAAGTVCSPINAGDGSKSYLDDANTTDGSGYIAIQFGPNPPLTADFDCNGTVTVNDLFAFLAAWFTGCQ